MATCTPWPPGEPPAASSSAGPLQETGAILGNLGRTLQGIQSNNQNGEYWMTLADVQLTYRKGGKLTHPADVVAARRGTNLARERRNRRARGMVLELQSLREQLQEWPGEELNTIHGALLDTLGAVEEELHRGLPQGPDPARLHDPGDRDVEASINWGNATTDGQAWWLHERHHGLGNAPGSDPRSPTEDILSEDSPASHRRRRMHGAFFNRHGPM